MIFILFELFRLKYDIFRIPHTTIHKTLIQKATNIYENHAGGLLR